MGNGNEGSIWVCENWGRIGVVFRDRISNGMERLILFDLKRRLLETALHVHRSGVGI